MTVKEPSYLKISEELIKKYGQDKPGKVAFVCHILHMALEKTNDQLDQENMQDYLYYDKHKDRYPEEYNYAKAIFGNEIHKVMVNIETTIKEGVFQEE